MNKILSYVRLHLRLMRTKNTSGKKSQIATTLLGLLTCVVMLFVFKYFLEMLVDQFGKIVEIADFSTVLWTIIEIILTVACVLFEIKSLLKPADLKIVARFPMSTFQTFVAELIIVFLSILLLSVCICLPIMLVFGFATGTISFAFIIRIIATAVFASLLPFGLGTILTVPVMYAVSAIENRNVLKLILFTLLLIGALALYDYVLNLLAEYFIYQRISDETISVMQKFITIINSNLNPCVLLKSIGIKGSILLPMVMILLSSVVLLAIGLLIAKPVYDKVRLNALEGGKKIFGLKSKYTSHGPFFAILKREFKDIIRTGTYAYYYLGVAITTPVMVFFCNRLVNKVGEAQVGANVAYGVSVLVLLAFMAMINSFSAQAISREKETFYITKITPYKYTLQLAAKGVLNLAVATGALLLSIYVIARLEFLTVGQSFLVFGVSFITALGMIVNGFNLNLSNPDLALSTNGDAGQTNMNLLMLIGLFVAIVQGGSAIVLSYLFGTEIVYIINVVITVIYTGINVLVFLLTAEKKYARIEFR